MFSIFSNKIEINAAPALHSWWDATLRHTVERELNATFEQCLECLLRPDRFLGESRYTYRASRLDGVYEIVFKWVKWGITRFYRVRLRVVQEGPVVRYVSTPDSDYEFYMEFHLRPGGDGRTRVWVEARMKAGLMADLLGRKDYARFVEELVDRGLGAMLSAVAEERRGAEAGQARPRCEDCLLYEFSNKYCYYLKGPIANPEDPPCGGRGFIEHRL